MSTPTQAQPEQVGDVFDTELGSAAAGGACVGRAPGGRVVFVRHGVPGERVAVRVTSVTKHFLRADVEVVHEASSDRVEAPCPYAGPGLCGGCDWQHVTLERQRTMKAELIAEHLRRIAGITREVTVEPVPGPDGRADDGLGWRTRIQLAVSHDGRPGLRKHRSHDLQTVDRCLIASPGVEQVGAEQARWFAAATVEVAATSDGSQRVVDVQRGGRGRPRVPDVDAGAVVDGLPVRTPHGLRHHAGGRSFEVWAGGFWQVHVGLADLLAGLVLEALSPQPGEKALDLYAGVGLFAALIGEAVGQDGHVLAVESDKRACADAARNTADLPQVSVRTASVEPALVARSAVGGVDVVVLDPPRAGAGLEVTAALATLRPRVLAYVSCEPASFARDARVLLDAGWSLTSLRAFDAYPMTEHVELLGVFSPP